MEPPIEIAERIRKLAKEKGLKIGELLLKCGTTPDLLSTMRKNYPRLDTIVNISEYLGVSLDYLIGSNDETKSSYNSLNLICDTELAFLEKYRSLSLDKRKVLEALIETML